MMLIKPDLRRFLTHVGHFANHRDSQRRFAPTLPRFTGIGAPLHRNTQTDRRSLSLDWSDTRSRLRYQGSILNFRAGDRRTGAQPVRTTAFLGPYGQVAVAACSSGSKPPCHSRSRHSVRAVDRDGQVKLISVTSAPVFLICVTSRALWLFGTAIRSEEHTSELQSPC